MTQYLLDTNIILRASDPDSDHYSLVVDAVFELLSRGDQCLLTPQVLIEFWAVATRPMDVNGFGWSSEQTQAQIDQLLSEFSLLPDNAEIFTYWQQLVTAHNIKGKRTHDIRLMAVMKAHDIECLLTLNPKDFLSKEGIHITHPDHILEKPKPIGEDDPDDFIIE